jgi:Mrp family chromosome partitioning ATPase
VVVLVVAPPESLDLKSRVAAELALALSESGHPRILLMEGDLQSPNVHRLLNVDMSMTGGFSQQLRARIKRDVDRRWSVIGCAPTLHVLAEGMMRTPGLLLSRQFSDSLSELRNYYDFIVIDGPSTSLEVESQALDAVVDGLVFASERVTPRLTRVQSLFGQKRISLVVGNS